MVDKPVSRNRLFLRNLIDKTSSYILLFLIVVLSLSLVRNISNIKRAESVITEKRLEVEKVRREKEELSERLEYTKSQEFLEKQLRDKLGLAKEGEFVVILPPPEVLRKFAPKRVEEEILPPEPNWKKWVKLFI